MRRPFVWLFPLFVAGILLQKYTQIQIGFWIILFAYGFFAALTLINKPIRLVAVGLVVLLLGFVVQQTADQRTTRLRAQTYGVTHMQLLSSFEESNWYWEAEVQLKTAVYSDQTLLIDEKAKLQIPKGEAEALTGFSEGDMVQARTLQVISTLAQRPLTGYEAYLRSQNVLHIVRANQLEGVAAPDKINPIKAFSGGVKESVEVFLNQSLPQNEAALLKSILFGNQGYLSDEMTENFSKSGTAHIVAVSGLHIGMIVVILEKLLSFFQVGKNQRTLLILGFIVAYTYLVGFPVSMIRAGAMYLCYVLAYFLHRKYDPLNALMLIGFGAVLWNPYMLVTVSFQLSFLATLSILLFYPILNNGLERLPASIRSLVAVTLAAQIGTIPITLYHFQQISFISLFSNLLIVPLMGAVLSLGLLATAISFISVGVGVLLNQITRWLLTYIYTAVKLSAALPYSSIKIEGTRIFYLCCYYGIILFIYQQIKSRKLIRKEGQVYNELSEIIIRNTEGAD